MKPEGVLLARAAAMLLILATPISTVLMSGQEAQVRQENGVFRDWTHHHLVFSDPGTAADAIRNGTYERWLKITSDPRYIMHQQERSANPLSATHDPSANETTAMPEAATPDQAAVPPNEARTAAIQMTLEERRAAQVGDRQLPFGLSAAIIAAPMEPADAGSAADAMPVGSSLTNQHHKKEKVKRNRKRNHIKKDWSETLGSNGSTGLGEFPVTFTATPGSTSCTSDFAVFNTGLAGTSGQASIVAFNNLYSACNGGIPTIYWAYNTGGTVVNSVAISLSGSQLALVQSNASGVASLVLLTWLASDGTLTAPVSPTSVAAGSYNGCTAPCMTTLTLSGSPSDSHSSPYVAFGQGSNFATAYVGDDAGNLHKFVNIFASGSNTPAEAGSPWPVAVNSDASLASPVYDSVSTNVFVGDYVLSSSSACEPSATNSNNPCGYLYSVNLSGTVTKSAQLDHNVGIFDAPIVDSTAGEVYVFAGDDGSTNCTPSVPCAAVYQFPVNFSAGASGTEATVGPGYEFLLSGTFDNAYFTSSTHTGHLYVVGNTGPANNTLYQVSINNNVMSTTTTAGPQLSSNYTNGYYSAGLQISEFDSSSHDYIFLGVLSFGYPSACGTASLGNGCVIGYNVNSGTISASTTPTGATAEAGGTSGIVIDSATSGAQNIYFSTLLNQTCTTSGGTGGCAIQVSQSAP
jgi:hypothetical protein